MSTITIHNKEYRIYEVTGKILESNKQRELHVYGSGGGGATYNGTGGTAPVNIQSRACHQLMEMIVDAK